MPNPVLPIIEARVSTRHYDPARTLTDADIEALVSQATRAPSAYNFQNWRFVAVRSPAGRQRLKAAAHGQQQVLDAAVTFIVCGTLRAHETLARALQPAVDAGVLPATLAADWVVQATREHAMNPGLQRDEAVRSASLAAMTLMLAAQGAGLASGAMAGFDAEGVVQAFGLSDNEVPVMLVTVGYPLQARAARQKPRRPVAEVIAFA